MLKSGNVNYKVDAKMIDFGLQVEPEQIHLIGERVLHHFSKKREFINSINVFPVADGDTGTNIELTLRGALDYVEKLGIKRLSLDEYLKHRLKGMILNSRGCSGSILALYFKGFVESLDLKYPSNQQIVEALKKGYESAYKGTVNPKEGTMLTLMREFYKKYKEFSDLDNPITIIDKTLPHLKETVKNTPNMLKILRDAGVVDSGALGFYVLLESLMNELHGKKATKSLISTVSFVSTVNKVMSPLFKNIKDSFIVVKDITLRSYSTTINYLKRSSEFSIGLVKRLTPAKKKEKVWNREIKFRYCTEFLLRPKEPMDEKSIHKKLEGFGNEIFIIKSNDIFKTHIHTNQPETVLGVFKNSGDILSIKVDDMQEQHRVLLSELAQQTHYKKDYAILIILNGEGFAEIVKSLGATDVLLYQDVKPSVLEIVKAIDEVKSKNIIVAVDDEDILMALKIAASLLKSKFNIELIETGNTASVLNMLYHNLGTGDIHKDAEAMNNAIGSVKFVKVSVANREMTRDGISINKGGFFTIYNKKIISSARRLNKAVREAILKVRKGESLITLYSGRTEKKKDKKLLSELKEEFKDINFELYYGGQNKYNYYLVFE